MGKDDDFMGKNEKRVLSPERKEKLRLARSLAVEKHKLNQERRTCDDCGLEGVSPCQSLNTRCMSWCKGVNYHICRIAEFKLCYKCANEKLTTKKAKQKGAA